MKASDGAGIDFIGADELDNEILGADEPDNEFLGADEPDNEILGADEPDNVILGSDESDTALLSSDESDESANTSDGEEKLHQDIRLILKENSGNVSKKWGNSEQWVLELRDGRRVAVPIQISLPPGEVTEVLGEQTHLALVPLKCSDAVEVSSAQVDENDVLVEDWVLDTSESTELPNVEGLSPLSVEPLAFSLPLAMEGQEVLGVENPVKGEAYSEWVQSRFKGFDNFLGTSLKGLENQATTFLLAVEAELHRRAALEKKASDLKSSGVKGIRELKGLFSSINYGSTSTRRSGINRERALSVPK